MASGDVYLQAGTKLEIVVGGSGASASGGGGGGGGSFVLETNGTGGVVADEVIAGGGGGGGWADIGSTLSYAGGGGQAEPNGGDGYRGALGAGGSGGGGGAVGGGGGGGFTGGAGGPQRATGCPEAQAPGLASPAASAAPAAARAADSAAAAAADFSGGGGGGGYGGGGGGGGGGSYDGGGGGGGGGSYVNPTNEGQDTQNVTLTPAANNGDGLVTIVYEGPACYCRGTLILTDRGETAVEALQIGDSVVTASGALRPIIWIGTRAYSARFAANNPDLLPIRFKVGSLADGVPRRDLLVSPEHAMFLDGVLISAKHLVNGATIVQEKPENDIDYFHIELESHDVLIAEGALSESFVDDDSRGMFQNAHEFRKLYPEARPKEIVYCAPRVEDGYILDRVRRRLAERAGLDYPEATDFGALSGEVEHFGPEGVSGWARNAAFPDAPVCLDVLVDGEFAGYAYADAESPNGGHGFAFRFAAPLDCSHEHAIELRRSADGAVFGKRMFLTARPGISDWEISERLRA